MLSTVFLILGFIVFVYSIILHEIAHGLVADRLGDPTARIQGRLTLNPISHIDPLMSIFLPLFLFFSRAGIILGAAKPVPIDPYNFQNPKKDLGLVGLAGPITNILIALFFSIIARIFPYPVLTGFLATIVQLNLILAVFNLIPIPPLDGGRVLTAILPKEYANALSSIENIGILIVFFLLLFPSPLFSLSKIIFAIASSIFKIIFPSMPLI